MAGAAAGFAGAFAGSGGDISAGLKGAITGAGFGAIGGHYGIRNFSPQRIAVQGAWGGISEEINGGKFIDGLRLQVGLSTLTAVAIKAREITAENSSRLGSLHSKESSGGPFQDRAGYAGGRINFDKLDDLEKYLPYGSPLGGHQGGPGRLGIPGIPRLSIGYNPGGVFDYVLESYSGIHDLWNQPVWYNSVGAIKGGITYSHKFFGEIWNGVGVAVTTPVALAPSIQFYTPSITHTIRDAED